MSFLLTASIDAVVPWHGAGFSGMLNLANAALCCWASRATSLVIPSAVPFIWALVLFFSFGNSRLN